MVDRVNRCTKRRRSSPHSPGAGSNPRPHENEPCAVLLSYWATNREMSFGNLLKTLWSFLTRPQQQPYLLLALLEVSSSSVAPSSFSGSAFGSLPLSPSAWLLYDLSSCEFLRPDLCILSICRWTRMRSDAMAITMRTAIEAATLCAGRVTLNELRHSSTEIQKPSFAREQISLFAPRVVIFLVLHEIPCRSERWPTTPRRTMRWLRSKES